MTSLIPAIARPSSGLSFARRKDPGTVFVAGASGQAGVRIAQTLLREGFVVRAGVPDLSAAQELARLAAAYKIISKEESRRLNAVESTFGNPESIAKAIGNAGKVVVTIGSGENGPTGEVTTSDAVGVIQAAQLAGVGHVAIVYDESLTTGSTYNVLDGITSFFNNLFSRSQTLTVTELLQKLVETDVSYTLLKARLTEDYSPESSYNVVVSTEGSSDGANDYKVPKSRIAWLVAKVFSNTAVAENKVVKVSTDPAALSKSVEELFSAIPEDGRRKTYSEALTKAKAEEEAREANEKALKAAEAAKKLEEVKKLEEQGAQAANLAKEAQAKAAAAAAGASVESFLGKAKEISSGLSWEKLSSQLTASVQKPEEKPKVQLATVRGQAKARTLPSLKAAIKPKAPVNKPKASPPKLRDPPKPIATQTESKPETRKLFGGIFQQETIYIDDD
ncbi:hypothetical protein NMG60_11034105 [Bertholletia excelsa]